VGRRQLRDAQVFVCVHAQFHRCPLGHFFVDVGLEGGDLPRKVLFFALVLLLRGFGAAFRYVILLLWVYTPCSFGQGHSTAAAAMSSHCRVIHFSLCLLPARPH
jgi:hypothetical protein